MTSGLKRALINVLREIRIYGKHQLGVIKANRYRHRKNLKINLACGFNVREGWVNVDLFRKSDLSLDLREKLPFTDNSCAVIYSEHFVEHLEYPETALRFFRECWRILQPAGVFSAGVPDTEWPLKEYATNVGGDYFEIAKREWHPEWCETRLEHINYHFRQGVEHQFAYDFETFQKALESCGFTEVVRREFDPELDSERRRVGTLYISARKA